jgi:DNA-binding transcriptional ArsR family regulator
MSGGERSSESGMQHVSLLLAYVDSSRSPEAYTTTVQVDMKREGVDLLGMRPPNDPRVQLLAELADETRYAVLERLEQGPASASELAERLDVSPTRLANHLRRLRDTGLVTVSHQGRLALYELAEPGLREIFSMLNGLRGAPPQTAQPVRVAATCYDHLAGQIGVALMDHLVQSRALEARHDEGELKLGPEAARGFAKLGVELPTKPARRTLAFSCMDPRIGRAHLGGQLGAQLATSLHQKGWLKPTTQPRRLELTPAGNKALQRLGIHLQEAADHGGS